MAHLGQFVMRYSARGHAFKVWEWAVPRVRDDFLDCAVYLYPDRRNAEEGTAIGGTGFLVGIPYAKDDRCHIYVVTNKHNIQLGSWTIRLNTKDGGMDCIDTNDREWKKHRDCDIAVIQLDIDPTKFAYRFVQPNMFLDDQMMKRHDIGPGDEVFIVGRFINHEGRQKNLPTLRFGNIAQMPWEKVAGEESFLVEARSISGYSGAPVFVHIPAGSGRPNRTGIDTITWGPWLLGINWGYINARMRCVDCGQKFKKPFGEPAPNSGMMGVSPAWRIWEMIDTPEMRQARAEIEADAENASGVTRT